MTRAKALFDSIVDAPNPIDVIEQLITDQTQEAEYLEFKSGKVDLKTMKRYWSEDISAFANTEDGVLIWGIKTDNVPSLENPAVKIDAAAKPDLVPDVIKFAEELKSRIVHATMDPLSGIEVMPFKKTGDEGFVVCFIPEGKHKPYRAMLDNTKNYFQRVADSSVIISHSFLRALFYPQIQPKFSCKFWYFKSFDDYVHYGLKITNTGTATAESLLIQCGFYANHPDVVFHPVDPLTIVNLSTTSWELTSRRDFHPGEVLELAGNLLPSIIGKIGIDFKIYSRHMQPRRQRLTVPDHLHILKSEEHIFFREVEFDYVPADGEWGD